MLFIQEFQLLIKKMIQVEFLRQYANAKGIIVDEVIEDYGSGLNYNRKKWNKLIDSCMTNEVNTIIVTHKDRFIRFGYDKYLVVAYMD